MKNYRLVIFVFALLPWVVFSGCDAGTKSVDSCGDSFVDPGEECDTDVGENTCASLGHYDALGELKCTDGCKFDRSDCGGRCGDSLVDAEAGEECDTANFNGNSCQSLGYGGGALRCTQLCQYDKTGCTNACGNGYREGEEACDDGNNRSGDGCTDLCAVEEGWLCNDANPSRCTTVCLDGIVAGEEECDTTNLNAATCESLGYYGGALECMFDCTFRTDACEAVGRCGDEAIQSEFGEVCDGADLADQTCAGLGFGAGTLICRSDCSDFDTTGCTQSSTCGDGTVQSASGELCDGDNLNGQTCVTRGFYAGDLACQSHCMAFDESQCQGRCGDATVQSAAGEVCDGAELLGQTCAGQGFYTGTLACSANCTSFNVVGCSGYCGDSTVQSAHGEVCDGLNHGGQTCVTQGYYGGTLTCNPNCQTFGLADCAAVGRCGDSLVQGGFGELCDGSNLSGQTCFSRGYYGGTLACASTCNGFVEGGCAAVGRCGDGVIQAAYGEVCDGGNLASQTCESRGFYGGILTCSADCRAFVETNCAAVGKCGDGTIQSGYGEECDGSNLAGQTCASQGFNPGTLSCSNCRFVTSGCSGFCGDGTIQAAYEQCDGLSLGGADCVSRGFYTGTLGCNVSSCQYDTGGCQYFCGDGVIQSAYGEQCDGSDFNGQTCETQGYYPGSLSCSGECDFQFGSCGGHCGDGLVQTNFGEECDGSNLNGQGCHTMGAWSGTLGCSECAMVISCSKLTNISLGAGHSCVLDDGGAAWCWGFNRYGQLGADSSPDEHWAAIAVAMPQGIQFSTISTGDYHSCALDQLGNAWCWGSYDDGRLGVGIQSLVECNETWPELECSRVPMAVSMPVGKYFVSISAAGNGTCALDNYGAAWCWGMNHLGQIGDNTTVSRFVPTSVIMPPGVMFSKIDAGSAHVCGLNSSGNAWCWGYNEYGQLGDGTTNNRTTPTPVLMPSGKTFEYVSAGMVHTCAIDNLGTAWCWGRNENGVLGDSTELNRSFPTIAIMPPGVTFLRIEASYEHSCANDSTGGAWCWGTGASGQLGNNSTAKKLIPTEVLVPIDKSFKNISAGSAFTCDIDNNGSAWCWGTNTYGRLGIGLSPLTMRKIPDLCLRP